MSTDDAAWAVLIPCGQSKVAIDFRSTNGNSGLSLINGQYAHGPENPTHIKPAPFVPERKYEFEATITPTGDHVAIQVRLDGEPWIEWEGAQEDLSVWEPGDVPHQRTLGIVVARGKVIFHELNLTMTDCEAWLLRPSEHATNREKPMGATKP